MPKEFLKKYLPDAEKLKSHKNLQFLGERLHEPNLWHLNRRSVSKAFGIGLFCAWIPTPTQMAFAAISAFYFRANLPIAVGLVWVTNPVTMPPLFYFAYRIGLWVMGSPSPSENFEFSLDGVLSGLGGIWAPFLLGCFIVGVICSSAGFFGINYLWRKHITQKWYRRQQKRAGIILPEPIQPFQQIGTWLQTRFSKCPEITEKLSLIYNKFQAFIPIAKTALTNLVVTLSRKETYRPLEPIYTKSLTSFKLGINQGKRLWDSFLQRIQN